MAEIESVTVDKKDLEHMVDFYRNLYAADVIYKRCQDKAFREHAKSCIYAQNIENAFRKAASQVGKEV